MTETSRSMAIADQSNREKEIFEQTLDIAPTEERLRFLTNACGKDAALLARVQALLRADESGESFLPEQPKATAGVITEKPGDRIGRYKLLQQIGEGGCGVVYMAEQEEPVRRRVALKVLKLGMDTKSVIARFEAERQALALMDHPNIAKVHDAGATETGRPYFVMELVRGIKITDYCDEKNLSTQARLDLFVQVCHAVQHAHQKGIIHRDLKPSNILVNIVDGLPVPKVIDFGIAKATNDQRLTDKTVFTAFEQFIGTPAYMSPEQAEISGVDVDTRSDIYSLGVLLYELLTGKTPFDAKELLRVGLDEMRRTIREKEPDRPSTRVRTLGADELTTTAKRRGVEAPELAHVLGGDLDWIVMKCLEKDRARRYETANGLASDIQRHLNNEPVVARPPSALYRIEKLVRRNRLAFSAAALVALALVLGIVASTWQAIRATRAEREQSLLREKAVNARAISKSEATRAEQEKNTARHSAYAASMLLAQADWDNNNIARLRQVLDETRGFPERGFEWYYWQRLCHLEVRTFSGHLYGVWWVALTADGQRMATAGGDIAKVWETSTGRELFTLKGHKHNVSSIAFSPNGHWIVTGAYDRTARVWEASTGRELRQLTGHTAVIHSVTFSPDGQWILTTSEDQTAKLWDASSGREVRALTGHTGAVRSAAFSPDGRQIVTPSEDHTARVWETTTGRELLQLRGHMAPVLSATFSPNGQRILTGGADGAAILWDASTGRSLLTLYGHTALWPNFIPDNFRRALPELEGHTAPISSAVFFPDGQRVVTGSEDGTAKIWDATTGAQLRDFKGHLGPVRAVAVTPDCRRIVTASWDGTAKLWEANAEPEPLTITGHTQIVRSVAFSLDGQRILTGGDDQTAKVWETSTGRELLTLKGHSGNILSAVFSSDGQRLVTGGEDNSAKVWDAETGRESFTLGGHRGWVRSVAFSADGHWIVTGSGDRTAKLWDAATGGERHTLAGHRGPIFGVAFSPDCRWLITASGDSTAKLWEINTGQELRTLKGESGQILSVAVSPEGQRILTGSEDGTVKVWEAGTGRMTLTLKGHTAPIVSATFSPDGSRIVTASMDKTAKLFDAGSGRELLTLKGHIAPITSAAFSPDGSRIVTGSQDKTARVWAGASQPQVVIWQNEERLIEKRFTALRKEYAQDQERQQAARTSDQGAIKQWLILAPLPLAEGETGAHGLDREQLSGEAQLRPRAGQKTLIDGKRYFWDEVNLTDYIIDFNQILGERKDFSAAYAVCYIVAEEEKNGLVMKMGCDDEAKVYLNAQQVQQRSYPTTFIADDFEVREIHLNRGLNVLVFKVVNEAYDWQGSVRLADKNGQPLKGIRVTLDPEAKE